MESRTDSKLLVRFADVVEKDGLPLTYKTVSRKFDVSVVEARRLLSVYVKDCRSQARCKLAVTFVLYGRARSNSEAMEEVVAVVQESRLSEWEAKLVDCVKEVYSVQSFELEDSRSLHMVDNPCDLNQLQALREFTMIRCPGVGPRDAQERKAVRAASRPVEVTANVLKKMEVEEKKIVAGFGDIFRSMKGKAAVPSPAEPVEKPKAGGVASWVKAGGLDSKKIATSPIKNLLVDIDEQVKPAVHSDPESDEDMFAERKPRRPAIRDDSDDDDLPHDASGLNDIFDGSDSNQSKDSVSGRISVGQISQKKKPIRLKKVGSGVSKTVRPIVSSAKRGNMGSFTVISEDERSDDEKVQAPSKRSLEIVPAKSKEARTVFSEEESVSEEETQPKRKRANKKTAARKNEEDNEEVKSRNRKTKSEISRKRRKKASEEENSDEEGRSRISPEIVKDEPLRPFLTTTPVQTSTKKRKQVAVKRVDDEGYTVTELVWKDVSDDDEGETPEEKPTQDRTVNRSGVDLKQKNTNKPAAKKENSVNANGKVQSSIMNFFKKA